MTMIEDGAAVTVADPAPPPAAHWTGADPDGRWLGVARSLTPALAGHAEEADRTGRFVDASFELLREHGILSMLVPAALGGGGASHRDACAVLAELARACPATALACSMHTHLVGTQVWMHRHGMAVPGLGAVATQRLVLVSSSASDWLASNGTARRVDGGYRFSGRKAPASGCPAGDLLVTSARWDDAPGGPQVVHAVVAMAAPGVHIEETWDTMGMRATGSHTVVLDEVFVPDEAVTGMRSAGAWDPVLDAVVGVAVPLVMATYVGVAEEAVARATQLAARRAERPEVAPLVGRMHNRLITAQDAVRAMIDRSDDLRFAATAEHTAACLSRKTIAVEAVLDAVRIALEVGGGAAYARGAGIERLFRDVHGALYHPLPAAQQERFTGRLALGLDPLGPPA